MSCSNDHIIEHMLVESASPSTSPSSAIMTTMMRLPWARVSSLMLALVILEKRKKTMTTMIWSADVHLVEVLALGDKKEIKRLRTTVRVLFELAPNERIKRILKRVSLLFCLSRLRSAFVLFWKYSGVWCLVSGPRALGSLGSLQMRLK